MWCASLSTLMASAPAEQSEGLSVQLLPTTVRSRTMTLTDPVIWMCPCTSAPQAPRRVLFEPTVTLPVMVPWISMTRAVESLAAVFRSASDDTTVVAALPPPVVVSTPIPETDAQPTSALEGLPAQPPAASDSVLGPASCGPPSFGALVLASPWPASCGEPLASSPLPSSVVASSPGEVSSLEPPLPPEPDVSPELPLPPLAFPLPECVGLPDDEGPSAEVSPVEEDPQ